MLRLFYNKEQKGATDYPWKIFDSEKSEMIMAHHVNINAYGQTEEKCKVGLCAAYVLMFEDAHVVIEDQDKGIVSIEENK